MWVCHRAATTTALIFFRWIFPSKMPLVKSLKAPAASTNVYSLSSSMFHLLGRVAGSPPRFVRLRRLSFLILTSAEVNRELFVFWIFFAYQDQKAAHHQ